MLKAKGKRKTQDPCEVCGLHKNLCICEFIPKIQTRTRLCLVIHHRELKRTSNTGQLAYHSLINSELRIRGLENQPLDLSDVMNLNFQPCLFFPSEDAAELTNEFIHQFAKPILLIVPDGNWRQASKVNTRHPEIKDIPRIKISLPNTNPHHLRAEHMPEGMATLEAIATAMGIIEGPEVKEKLMNLYQAKLKNTLHGRGIQIFTDHLSL